MIAEYFAFAGVWLNMLGVIGLFFFGMPFHVPARGSYHLLLSGEADDTNDAKELLFAVLGWISLVMILLSAVCQTAAVLHA